MRDGEVLSFAMNATVNAGATIPNRTNVGNAAQSPKANLFALPSTTPS